MLKLFATITSALLIIMVNSLENTNSISSNKAQVLVAVGSSDIFISAGICLFLVVVYWKNFMNIVTGGSFFKPAQVNPPVFTEIQPKTPAERIEILRKELLIRELSDSEILEDDSLDHIELEDGVVWTQDKDGNKYKKEIYSNKITRKKI